MECGNIRVTLSRVGQTLFRGEPELFQKTERVAVPGGYIQVRAQRMVVEAGVKTHEVMGDVSAGRMRPQQSHLRGIEGPYLVGAEATEIQHVRRVRFGHRQVRQVHFRERTVLHAPEHVTPGRIERVNAGVLLLQPAAKGCCCSAGVADDSVVTTVFVIGLPGHYCRVLSVALCQRQRDALAFGTVAGMREAVVAS